MYQYIHSSIDKALKLIIMASRGAGAFPMLPTFADDLQNKRLIVVPTLRPTWLCWRPNITLNINIPACTYPTAGREPLLSMGALGPLLPRGPSTD